MKLFWGFRYLAWSTALCLATYFAYGAFGFGRIAEPEQTDLFALLFFVAVSLVSQLGLIVAPWSLSAGVVARVAVAVLMAPTALFLGLAAWEGGQRLAAGNPISTLAWTVYLAGVGVYALAYVALILAKVPR